MRVAVRLVHLVGLVLMLGSIATFLVASSVGGRGSVVELAVARRIIAAGSTLLTVPGLALLVLSGTALSWMGRGRGRRWPVRVMALAAAGMVGNGVLVVLPAVREATALAEASLVAGHLVPAYPLAFARESLAGSVNVALALVALVAGALAGRARARPDPESSSV